MKHEELFSHRNKKCKCFLELRETEQSILIHLLKEHIQEGSYFGRKDQHYKMCKELLEKLTP